MSMRLLTLTFLVAGSVACFGQQKTAPAAPAPAAPPVELPAEPGLYAVFDTSMGAIVAKLYEDKAPITVQNFTALARGTKAALNSKDVLVKRPFYNGLTFHRVIKGFMIQTGDPHATGTSKCGFPNLRDEIDKSLNFKEPGRLAMANTGSPNTGGCQIFITVGPADYLTGMYTIFGQVVSGQDVADRISQVPTAREDKPVTPVIIKSVTVQRKQ
jgi:peptidyl-prolyl cis-trans isomerase A (cyclophilin A)